MSFCLCLCPRCVTMYSVSHTPRCNRLSILAPEVYLRRNDSPAPVVLNDRDALWRWQMEIDAPEWAKIESSKLLCLSMTHTLARLETGDLTEKW